MYKLNQIRRKVRWFICQIIKHLKARSIHCDGLSQDTGTTLRTVPEDSFSYNSYKLAASKSSSAGTVLLCMGHNHLLQHQSISTQ